MPGISRCKNSFRLKILNNWHIQLAARVVGNGGVIAYPTEAVYGLGCSPWDKQAIQRLLRLKRRSVNKGLIVVAANIGQLQSLVNFNHVRSIQSVLKTWPGPVTWVLPSRRETPPWLCGKHGDLAVRVSAHPQLGKLCGICGPLVSTSANPANTTPAKTATDVRKYFHDALDYILPGKLGTESGPSEIRHARSGQVLRHSK